MEKKLAILGAHTAVGRAVAEAIADRELPVAIRKYTTLEHLGEDLFPLGPEAVSGADCAVIAFAGDEARSLAERAAGEKKLLVDIGGALPGPYLWPVLDASARLAEGAPAAIATGLAGPIAAVLRALAPFGLVRATITTFESAAVLDQRGMDELSEQVRALYTLADPPMAALPGRLAFAVIPSAGAMELPFDGDQVLANQIVAGVGPDAPELRITRVMVPSFSAEGASLELEAAEDAEQVEVEAAVRASRGLHLVREPAHSTAEAIGRDDALVSRVRTGPGPRIGLFLAADRLRAGSATPAVLLLERWLGTDAREEADAADGSVPDLHDS